MNSKELVKASVEHREVPRVPFSIGFTEPARKKMSQYLNDPSFGKKILGDLVSSPVIKIEYGVRDENGFYTDEFGVVWDRTRDPDIGIAHPVITPDNFEEFAFPDPASPGRFDRLAENLKAYPDKFQIMALDFSLYERAWTLRGLENFLIDMIINQDFAEALLDRILKFNLAVIDAGLSAYPEVDAVYFGDDFGTQTDVVMGVSRWCQLLKPRLAEQYGRVKHWGKKVFIHSCGAVADLFPHLVEIGVDCFNPFQPEVMDVYSIKEQYSGKLAFWGGISTQRLLPYGSVDDVRDEVGRLLSLGRQGGYIAAPAHAIPADAKPENIEVMLDLLENQ